MSARRFLKGDLGVDVSHGGITGRSSSSGRRKREAAKNSEEKYVQLEIKVFSNSKPIQLEDHGYVVFFNIRNKKYIFPTELFSFQTTQPIASSVNDNRYELHSLP